MNERIRELAIEAGYDWAWDTQIDFGHKEMEKFAELIVRECLSNIEDCDGDLDFAIWKTKKDFGVEE